MQNLRLAILEIQVQAWRLQLAALDNALGATQPMAAVEPQPLSKLGHIREAEKKTRPRMVPLLCLASASEPTLVEQEGQP